MKSAALVVVAMFYADHGLPHFHARYGGDKAAISIAGLRILEGSLPPRALGLVMEWAAQHREQLMQDWEKARSGQPPDKIEPLR